VDPEPGAEQIAVGVAECGLAPDADPFESPRRSRREHPLDHPPERRPVGRHHFEDPEFIETMNKSKASIRYFGPEPLLEYVKGQEETYKKILK